mgnify:CR=1 FL=1
MKWVTFALATFCVAISGYMLMSSLLVCRMSGLSEVVSWGALFILWGAGFAQECRKLRLERVAEREDGR